MALSRGLHIKFDYVDRAGQQTQRTAMPIEYCMHGNCVRAFCLMRADERVFAFSRMSNIALADVSPTDCTKVPLFQHQNEMLRLLSENDRFLLLAEMGTGKTLPVLVHISNLLATKAIRDALVVAPLSAIGAWMRDAELLSAERCWLIKSRVTFINWDRLSRKDNAERRKLWRAWGCIVLDEAHALANPTSNRTRYFAGHGYRLGMASLADRIYLLTGTLVTNRRLRDLWAPLRCLLGDDWMAYPEFKKRYLDVRVESGQDELSTPSAQELLAVVGKYSYRVLKADCLDLPEMMPDTVIEVPFSSRKNAAPYNATTRDLYYEAADRYRESLQLAADSPFARFMRMRQIAAGCLTVSGSGETDEELASQSYQLENDKLRYALELIESNLPHKTVVFHEFTASGLALERVLQEAGISYVALNGAQADKTIWRRFQGDPSISVIIVQYRSGSAGIDLFAASSTIYLEPSTSSTVLSQSRGRTHRSGQRSACNYYFLLTEDSLEVDIYERTRSGEDFTEQAYREIASQGFRHATSAQET